MRSKFNSVFALAAAAAITFAGVGSALAATISVSDVGGSWTALLPPDGPSYVKGLNTNSVSWGTPYAGLGGSGKQSGYSFVGAAAKQIETDKDFVLGKFTHNNFVLESGTSIDGANLSVVVNLVIGGAAKAVNAAFKFVHDETANNGEANGLCKNGGANRVSGVNVNGCADSVSILNNTTSNQSFDIDGFQYILEITGFTTMAGQFFSEFWTTENALNTAFLKARFKLVGPTGGVDPVPSPVPLPAAGWMMLAGIAALTAARARRKS